MEMGIDYLNDILKTCRREETLACKYRELYRIFQEILKEKTLLCKLDFSGPFARMDYLCKEMQYAEDEYRRINSFRARGRDLHLPTSGSLVVYWDDVKALTNFISRIYNVEIPQELKSMLPKFYRLQLPERKSIGDYLRVIVDSWDDRYIYGKTADENSEFICVSYAEPNYFGDWSYLNELLTEHSQLNLVRPRRQGAIYYPELIIYEPDFLLDVSSIATCFESYGCTHLTYLVNKIKPAANTKAILLGNFAGQLLDESIHHHDGDPVVYKESVTRFFQRNALNLITCMDMDASFHTDAMGQQQILEKIIREQFPQISHIDMQKILLEPSFCCEMLGIQGRMDLLQEDMRVLMEQKSGKRAYLSNKHVEKHYVQMLLYLALLHYNFRLRNEDISCFLLYSKYEDGLMKEGPAPELLYKAIWLRNQIVRKEFDYGEGKVGEVFDHLYAEDLNVDNISGKLWEKYTEPQLAGLLAPIHRSSELERAYFYRFFTFIEKEHILSKLGNARKEGSGFASTWNDTLEEKRQNGNIYDRLQIIKKENSTKDSSGIDWVTLQVPQEEETFLPNFRVGDIAVLYAYPKEEEPDIRKTMVLRCSIKKLYPDQVVLKLRSPQKNEMFFLKPEGYAWAIEHDFVEASFSTLYKSVYAFLTANADRKKLLLNQRMPKVDRTLTLKGDYSQGGVSPEFNELVLKAKQAKDYFLLIGPPGTGKTSFGLVNILKEELISNENSSILLVSFTNRAVDEICSKLVKQGIDFIRIGSSVSCDETYQSYLLENRMSSCTHAAVIRKIIADTRVFVGTTTALSSNVHLFGIKRFDLAIVDEASQILEPHLLALLCAKFDSKENAIDKFVLIGDHKQLPAVVMQNEADSRVEDPLLREQVGLTNCRLSLFERLLRLQKDNDQLIYCLEKQGRMHPEVSQFPNRAFYNQRLKPVPLKHQCSELSFPKHAADGLELQLATKRILFFPSEFVESSHSVKVNLPEAKQIAEIVRTVWELYKKNGKGFESDKTIGIIVPYRNQIAIIQKEIARYDIPELNSITIDTVERYQGSERDVVIYGFTIRKSYQLSFLVEHVFEEEGATIDRKLNVALTRAREQLILVGNPALLSQNELFGKLIEYAKLS